MQIPVAYKMLAYSTKQISLVSFILVCLIIVVNGKSSCVKLATMEPIQRCYVSIGESNPVLELRGGEAITIGKRKKQKPSIVYMVKAFFR